MVNYDNGKIYKIVCNKTGLIYIGSTTKKLLCQRLTNHVCLFKRYKNGKHNFITSFKVLENNDYNIILLENFPCESKDELHARERYYIESIECVNKCIPTRKIKEYNEKNKDKIKEKMKEYRDNNKDKISDKKKEYYENNKDRIKKYYENNKDKIKEYYENIKDKIKEKQKEYYEDNKDKKKEYYENHKDKIKEKRKEYYENHKDGIKEYYKDNKDKLNEKIICECGGKYTYQHKFTHIKTKKHQKYLNNINGFSNDNF